MSSEPNVIPLVSKSLSTVPRAVWIAVGVLGIATAALAGALVMRSVEPTAPGSTVSTAENLAGQPVPLMATTPAQSNNSSQPASIASAKPVHKPVPTEASTATAQGNAPGDTIRAALCASCGVVESVTAVQQKGQGTGLGAVAGGVLGGVVGHQIGGGGGKTAMTVLGAIGGGLAGNEVEKRARSETLFNIQVRMEDGNVRSFQRAQSMAVGTRVVVEGSTMRASRDSGKVDAPRVVRTSAPT